MKAAAIRDASIDKNRDLSWLLYYPEQKIFHIEICDGVDEWEAPLIISSFVRRGEKSLDPQASRLWVEQRIVPPDRQNLGMILRDNGLQEYDEYRLLMIADGRCAQDDCFVVPLKSDDVPAELKNRLSGKISSFLLEDDRLLLFFRDGMVRYIERQDLFAYVAQKERAGRYKEHIRRFLERRREKNEGNHGKSDAQEIALTAGGHGLLFGGEGFFPAEELRRDGLELPVTKEDFCAYARENILDTAAAAELMQCTRQNILDLVRRGKLRPFMTLKNNYLFLREELAL